jgi:hypothetical protein
MEGWSTRLELVWAGTVVMALMGSVPLKFWRSFAADV